MNYNRVLKAAPLPPGFYSICGAQGAGKTSLAVALLRTDYRYYREWRYEQAVGLAREYYRVNGIKLDISKNLYFSKHKIILDRRRGISTHEIDIERLGLPNDDYTVQYLPRGSVVFIEEADVLAYCQNWQSLSVYLRNLIKYVRHNMLTIIFDMQVGGDLAKALRNLTVGQFYIVESGIKRFLLFWKRQEWRFLYIRSQLNNVVKEFSKLGVNIKIPVVEWGRFHVWGNVFDCYNSFSGVPYYLKGIENVGYVYNKHVDGDLSIEGIERYCKAHPLEQSERSEGPKKRQEKKSEEGDNSTVQEPYSPF